MSASHTQIVHFFLAVALAFCNKIEGITPPLTPSILPPLSLLDLWGGGGGGGGGFVLLT